jgi:peptide/nickel transport system ATP-binding protein
MQADDILLEVQGLKKYFPLKKGIFARHMGDVKAVDGVNFQIRRGETLGLVGESGSGKTTVGRSILRALEPSEGTVRFSRKDESWDIAALGKRQLKGIRPYMQMIFQDPYSSLNPRMTVRDIIAEPLIVNGICSRREVDEKVRNIAARCKLNIEHLRRFPHAFSAGQRQRIGIARGLILEPDFVVCDESVSSLDVSVQAEIINLLQDLQEELGLTYLFIAHDLSVVEHICDRIAVMYLGKIVELSDTKSLFSFPRHPYTEALMSAVPQADPREKMKPVFLEGEIPNPMNPPSGCAFHPRCHYAQDLCRTKCPELVSAEDGHRVACHFASELKLQGIA